MDGVDPGKLKALWELAVARCQAIKASEQYDREEKREAHKECMMRWYQLRTYELENNP